jgi:hypothetical protein
MRKIRQDDLIKQVRWALESRLEVIEVWYSQTSGWPDEFLEAIGSKLPINISLGHIFASHCVNEYESAAGLPVDNTV